MARIVRLSEALQRATTGSRLTGLAILRHGAMERLLTSLGIQQRIATERQPSGSEIRPPTVTALRLTNLAIPRHLVTVARVRGLAIRLRVSDL